MTKRDAMVRDITGLIEYGRQNHVQDDGVIEVSVTYHYKYAQLGRRYATAQVPTLQSMGSGIRKTAGEGTYWDLDFHSLAHSDRPDIAIYSGHVALCAADRQHFR